MNTTQPCYIVSVWKDINSLEENRNNQLLVSKFLWKSGYDFAEVLGYYEGQIEESFVLFNEEVAQIIANRYNQECYLSCDSNRYSTLNDKNGNIISKLGIMKSSKDKPVNSNYTYDKYKEVYYYV